MVVFLVKFCSRLFKKLNIIIMLYLLSADVRYFPASFDIGYGAFFS